VDERASTPASAPAPAPGPAETNGHGLEEIREQFLRVLLERFESGGLPAYDYTQRVQRVESAMSASEMVGIVEAPPPQEPALDVVDMLRLSRTPELKTPGGRRPRFWWMILLGFFFVVLMIVGLWLVAHARSLHNSGGSGNAGAITPPAAVVAGPAR
jgi:hypothetical protein